MTLRVFGSVRSSRSHNLRPSVRPFVRSSGPNLSRALNLHLLASILQDHFMSVSGQSKVSLRSVSGQSLGSLRSVSGISVLTSSDRWSLKQGCCAGTG